MVRYFYDAVFYEKEKLAEMCEILKDFGCREAFFFLENDGKDMKCIKDIKNYIKKVAKDKINFKFGIFVKNEKNVENLKNLKKKIGDSLIIAIEVDDFEVLRKIVDQKAADIIVDPQRHRKDEGIDHVIAKKMKENNTGLMITLSNLFSMEGKRRCMEFGKIKEICKYYNKYSFPLLISSFVSDPLLIRDPVSRASLMRELGVKEDKALDTVSKNYSKIKNNGDKGFVVRWIK